MSLSGFRNFSKTTFPNLLIIVGLLFLGVSFGPFIKDELWYYIKELKGQIYSLREGEEEESPFGRLITTRPIKIVPKDTNFGLVIEKIGVNAPIVKDVPVWDEVAYKEALKSGVAHASLSPYPSEGIGNVYLFAHASLNFFQYGEYATVFNLLRKLEIGDRIHVFYEGKTYVYETVNKEFVKGWNTYPITRPVLGPTLTLQTCDPPGATINRLVVTATLVDSY